MRFKPQRQPEDHESGAAPLGAGWPPPLDEEIFESRIRTAGSPKHVRAELQRAVQRRIQELESHFDTQYRAYVERTKVQDVRPDIERVAVKALGEIEIRTSRTERKLGTLRNEYANKLSDYNHFKEHNRLNREPHYPPSKLRHSLLAIAAGVGETFLNGNLLAVGAQGGLIQGWTLALGISVINVGGAFCGGNAGRLLNDRTTIRKGLGFLSVLFCVVILILFNLLVAHYREALLASAGYAETIGAGKRAWEAFSRNYFGVSDFMSWLLFGMGMMSAGLGAWKGYSMEDPYPGYCRRARALKHARDELQEEQEAAMEELAEFQEEGVKNIDHYANQFRRRLTRAREIQTRLLELPRNFQREREKLLSQIEVLHAKYCPNEEPVTSSKPLPELETPPIESIDFALIEECARDHHQKLIDRCNTAMNSFKATA